MLAALIATAGVIWSIHDALLLASLVCAAGLIWSSHEWKAWALATVMVAAGLWWSSIDSRRCSVWWRGSIVYGKLSGHHSYLEWNEIWRGVFGLYLGTCCLGDTCSGIRSDPPYEMHLQQVAQKLLSQPRYQDPKRLNRHEARMYSQAGEDGMIAEIFRRIGVTNKVFVEFGSGDGHENNTVFLLCHDWTGLWIDADRKAVNTVRKNFAADIQSRRLIILEAIVAAENIENLLARANVPLEFDLLSIDIDRNDYWVWRKIERYRPRTVVVEYNEKFPPGIEWVIEYDANAFWDGTDQFGASLTAFEILGRRKGYVLVGCTLGGVNAFFVRQDLIGDRFSEPYTALNHYEPSNYDLRERPLEHPKRP